MKKELSNLNVKELSITEMNLINAGGIGFNWLGQAVGYLKNFVVAVSDAWSSTPEGQAAQQALRDFQ
jgi:hypothetical protein